MRDLLLVCTAVLALSSVDLRGEALLRADAPAITAALESEDAKALISALSGRTFDLTPEDSLKASHLLLDHLPSLPPDDVSGRQAVADLLIALTQAQVDGARGTSNPPAENSDILPPEVASALSDQDAEKLVALVLQDGFPATGLGPRREELIKVISDYARPLPASDAKANKEAYQALLVLDPDNSSYEEKAENYARAEIEAKSAAVKKLNRKEDEFNGFTFYSHPAEPRYADDRSYLLPYIAEKGGIILLRVQLHYTADSWLFIHSAKFNVDGEVIPFSVPSDMWKRDNDSEIWEWVDVPLDTEMRTLLEKVAHSKKTIVRFDGQQYYDDFTVTEKDKAAIRDVFAAEEFLRQQNQ